MTAKNAIENELQQENRTENPTQKKIKCNSQVLLVNSEGIGTKQPRPPHVLLPAAALHPLRERANPRSLGGKAAGVGGADAGEGDQRGLCRGKGEVGK